ncbi:hypothetical protein C2E23DRAFT_90740 [Lenzites betulinus]|nr:hypothetical protein C2E23DRAFT_90740 [Lenzites betulinus]
MWVSHHPLDSPTRGSAAVTSATLHQRPPLPPMLPITPFRSTTPMPASVSPANVFAGLRPPVSGTTNARRMDSAARHSASGSSRRGSSTRAVSTLPNTSTTRSSGTNLFSPAVAPSASATSASVATLTRFVVGFYPFMLSSPSYRPSVASPAGPELRWSGDDLSNWQYALSDANLIFTVVLSGSANSPDPVWAAFDEQVTAHCVATGVHMTTLADLPNPGRTGHQRPPCPATLSWQLLKPGTSRNVQGTRMTSYEGGNLTPVTFCLSTLSSSPYGPATPNHFPDSGLPFLMIGMSQVFVLRRPAYN